MKKTGNWGKYARRLDSASRNFDSKMKKSVGKAAVKLSTLVKKNITDGGETAGEPFEALDPRTIARKGSSAPLIDHGDMRNSVKPTKVDLWGWFVGITGEETGEDGASIAEYAAAHEYGAINSAGTEMFPARPWFFPVVKKFKPELIKEIEVDFKELFS